jgi:outer membrane usher protein
MGWLITNVLGTSCAWSMPDPASPQAPQAGAASITPQVSSPKPQASSADTGELEFSNAFTGTGKAAVDISRFETGATVLPGSYKLDIFVNERRVTRQTVEFRAIEGAKNAQPCFTYAELVQMSVDVGKLNPNTVNPQNFCIVISDISPDAAVKTDMGELRLDVSIPQASLKGSTRGYVNPELWDEGEAAFLLGYTFNAYASDQRYSVPSPSGSPVASVVGGAYEPVQNGTYYTRSPEGIRVLGPNGQLLSSPNGIYMPLLNRPSGSLQQSQYHLYDVNAFLGLNMGLNVGGWRLRSQETATWDKVTGSTRWNNVGAMASHDVTSLRAQLGIGDGYTQGILFDTTPFRGVTLYTDDRMLPDSQTGYAPVVRGIANTQARVEVRQSGNLLYETTVAPGPFVISDLYATGYGGDIIVIVFEADGTTHSFTVPYSAIPMLLRAGANRWAMTAGQVRDTSLSGSRPYFAEATYQRGINNWLTLYGGLQSTQHNLYRAYLGGLAFNTPIGAVSLDVTDAHTNLRDWPSLSGYSMRLSYAKTIPSTDTTIALASYRYSNGDYLTLSEAVTTQDRIKASDGVANPDSGSLLRAEQSLQVTISQNFALGYGALYFTGSYNEYWNVTNKAMTYQLGYNNSLWRLNYSIVASRTYGSTPTLHGSRFDNQIGINLSIPLGSQTAHTPVLAASAVHDSVTGNNDRLGLSGSFGETNQYNYSANVSYADAGNASTSAGGNIGWQAPYATLNGGYSYTNQYQQASVSASGGLVIHQGGITLASQVDPYDPVAIVEAKDAKGARVSSSGQARVNESGYAVANGLTPYRMNDVTLDPIGTSADVELQTTRLQTAPRAGAVIPLKFETVSGRAVLIHATQVNGEPLPFGAQVLDVSGHDVGTVAQNGQLFLRGAESGGQLSVSWGDAPGQQCQIQYSLPARAKDGNRDGFTNVDAVCH